MHAHWHLTLFVLLLAYAMAAGQGTGAKLNGIVIADEEGGGPPLGNISLTAGDDAAPAASDQLKGTFTFVFPNKKAGNPVDIHVKAEGYVLVNSAQFPINLPSDPLFLSDLALMVRNLGYADAKQNRMDDARQHTEEALRIYERLASTSPESYLPEVASALYNLAFIDRSQDRIGDARRHYVRALAIFRESARTRSVVFQDEIKGIEKRLEGLKER